MKILRPGNIPFEYVKINCQYCDCEFIAHKETEVEHTYNQKDGDSYYVICPCCEKRLYISDIERFLCDEDGNKTQKKYNKIGEV